jgi:hypothetical protein
MIFKDKLTQLNSLIEGEFNQLYTDIIANQNHDGDLLLLLENCSYKADYIDAKYAPAKVGTYIMGPGKEGHSEHAHYDFIHQYRTRFIHPNPLPEYLSLHEYSPERQQEIDKLVSEESITIQLEMLIYLKIWEMDMFIKKLYQLVRLSLGEPYDWHFKIKETNRENAGTDTRQNIIRLDIRDRIKKLYPNLYTAIKTSYKTQIRNSIAHSKYSFLGRNIHPNNFIQTDPAAQIKSVSFDEWIDIFHYTLLIYNNMISLTNKANEHCANLALHNQNKVEIRIGRKFPIEEDTTGQFEFRSEFKDWMPVI